MEPAERQLRQRAKIMMRRRARALRSSMPRAAIVSRSSRICQRLVALAELAKADSVGLFWPIERNKEVDLRPLLGELGAVGKRVAYPAISPEDAGLMSFRWVDDPGSLTDRGKGFAEPPSDAQIALGLAVIVVPALLFDARGHRLGYGAGYYDRTLPRFRPPALAIGVAFDFQLAPEIPTLEDDVAVDLVVTDSRTLDLRR